MANSEMVKLLQEVPSLSAPVTLSAHEKRLERIVGRMINRLSFDEDETKWLKGLKVAGFDSIITTDWALQFKYHAGISILGVCEEFGTGEYPKQTWWYYAGDIPELALDSLESFKKVVEDNALYNSRPTVRHANVTIHSMETLPIKKQRTLPRVDPVLVGWMTAPCFTLSRSGLIHRHSSWDIRGRSIGVIISAWDNENEIIDHKKIGASLLKLLT